MTSSAAGGGSSARSHGIDVAAGRLADVFSNRPLPIPTGTPMNEEPSADVPNPGALTEPMTEAQRRSLPKPACSAPGCVGPAVYDSWRQVRPYISPVLPVLVEATHKVCFRPGCPNGPK